MKPIIALGLLVLALAVACSGGRGEEKATPTPRVVSSEEIAKALTGFTEAFVNNKPAELSQYLSVTCESADRSVADTHSRNLGQLFGGKYHLKVEAAGLIFEPPTGDQVRVPLDQPEGVLSATIEGLGAGAGLATPGQIPLSDLEGPLRNPLPFESDIELVFKDGGWKVANCGDLFVEEEEDEEEEAESTATVIP